MLHTPDLASRPFKYFEYIYDRSNKNCILIMTGTGAIISVNNAFTNWFGYLPEDIVGRHFSMLFTSEKREEGEPEKEIEKVLQTGHATDDNYLVCKNQSIHWVSGESILVPDDTGNARIVKLLYNIQTQKEVEQSLKHSNSLNENVLSIVSDAVLVVDEQLNIIKTNKKFNELFNHCFTGSRPLHFSELSDCDKAFKRIEDHTLEAINSYSQCTQYTVEIEIASGQPRAFDVTCSFLENLHQGGGMLIVLHDVTSYKQQEKAKDDAIGFVAHELRNPLSNIMLVNELLGEYTKSSQPEVEDLLKRNKNNILRLEKMIRELYDATIADAGNLKLDFSHFNLQEMIQEAVSTVLVLHRGNNIFFEGAADITIDADRYRLIQVITNYLNNAIKYSPPHGTITLRSNYDEENVTIAVEDSGIGIVPEHLPLVFNRFFRAEKKSDQEGIGLGLYLSRKIVQAHNGKVWAVSEEGKGSSFYFSVPRRPAAGNGNA